MSRTRGLFIVFEGIDRCGKTTQVSLLVDYLQSLSPSTSSPCGVKRERFPDRSTSIGGVIDGYLTSKHELDDRVIHLLFSANRWEKHRELIETLDAGAHVVCDRYAYSGVAFSAAKVMIHLSLSLFHIYIYIYTYIYGICCNNVWMESFRICLPRCVDLFLG